MTIQVSSKQKMTPTAVCGLNPAHHITVQGLIKDPLGRKQIGKNLVFYVALRDIDVQEELLIDYGPNYNPFQRIKKESED